MSDNPQNVDQLRERLRTLGYLDAPVDRYVLGSGRGRAGTARFALGAGLRVGLLAGVLLGMSAAIALAVRAPGFVSSRRDAVVLAVMLSALFALAAAAAVTATALAASWYARRRGGITRSRARMVAATGGIIVALACTAYLTLWWTAAQGLFTSLAFGWNAAALALAAAVALLLAHAVSVVILAALARSTASADIPAGGVLSSRGFLVTFGILLFAGSAALLATGAGRRVSGQTAFPITVVPTGYALRVIAIDGFDIGQNLTTDMPALSRLKAGATVPFHNDPSDTPDPARDWTTIATGRPPDVHGIASLEARRAVGIEGRLPAASSGVMRSVLDAADLLRLTTPAVASGQERRVPAFWEVAAAAGLRISVVNWWATWPAPEGDDMVISDRALLRLDAGGALDAEIAPSRLYELLRVRWAAMRASAADRAAAAFAEVANPQLRKVLVRSAELDILVAALGSMNPGPAPLDLKIVYLPGLDIAQYNLLQASGAASVSAMSERVAGIQRYYRFLDTLVAELLPASPSHIDAIILWPGRVGGRQGAMLLSGPPINPGTFGCEDCREPGPAGMILYLLGLPIADNLASRPMMDAVADDFRTRHPVRSIPNYDAARMRRSVRTGQPLDAEALERLRSLGYIR